MLEKIRKIKEKFDELTQKIADPEIIADNKLWQKLIKERNSLEDLTQAYDKLSKIEKELADSQKALKTEKDKEMVDLYKEEIDNCLTAKEELEEEIKVLLLPKDENDESNVIIEIRPAAGGDEAALFASVLMNMYIRYGERNRWQVEISDMNQTEIGGIKEVSFLLKGKNAYSRLKFESGVHRVQRVPETENQGRIHTSTCTVAVLPEVEDVDFEILDKDLRIDTYRSSGAGGQHVNKTESAIRITHLPTGIVVACQDERSQIKNREKAMRVLQSKLYEYYKEQQDKEYRQNRKDQVGTGDRSERIRTYNYPQGRITDHRINFSVFNMVEFMDGNLDEMIDELLSADRKIKLENANIE